ncbi:MAG TPA: hypothetical protein VK150_08340, partial [Geothrix sp.]|nr:hypothetical protein [Geothrix sp.]
GCRTPMPWTADAPHGGFSEVEAWLPMSPEHLKRSVAGQTADPDSVLAFYRRFLAWRKGSEALCRGAIHFHQTSEPILALRREDGPERVLAVFNLSPAPAQYTLQAKAVPFEGHGLASGRLEGRVLHLPPWGGFFGRLA